jgi:hypothetical protein
VVGLSGCFESEGLFADERLWDKAWQQRYVSGDVEYVVLALDEASRTYLIGSRKADEDVEVFHAALYPGWDDYLILGTQKLPSPREKAIYNPIRRASAGAVELVNLICGEAAGEASKSAKGGAKAEVQSEGTCLFPTLDALRQEMKKEFAAQKSNLRAKKKVQDIKTTRSKALGSIGAATEIGTFEDGTGVHGALRVKSVAAGQGAAKAGVRAGELIVAVSGERSLTARALEVLIAFAKPGEKLRLTLYDPATRATRDVDVTAVE